MELRLTNNCRFPLYNNVTLMSGLEFIAWFLRTSVQGGQKIQLCSLNRKNIAFRGENNNLEQIYVKKTCTINNIIYIDFLQLNIKDSSKMIYFVFDFSVNINFCKLP